jgi:hypothetical protein
MDINISKKIHQKNFIVPCVEFSWMDKKWQNMTLWLVLGELHSSWKWVVTTKLQWFASYIQWVVSGHCNLKTKLQS